MITDRKARRFFGFQLIVLVTLFSLLFISVGAALASSPGVDPQTVAVTVAPGASTTVNKTVHTPPIPPKPDIVFLADTTGSMGSAIANVKANAAAVMAAVIAAQPDAQFAVGQYRDKEHCAADPFDFQLDSPITANTAAAQAAINSWTTGDGCDVPENQLYGLDQLATNPAVGFRTGSTRIIAWFGDASGHDPANGVTLAAAIADLQAAGVRVIAVPVSGGGDGLDSTGQATAITGATGGVLLPAAAPEQVAAAILAGLQNLPVTVAPALISCGDANVTVNTFTPASRTVTSGQDAAFTETVSVNAAAGTPPQGTTVTCTVDWKLDGASAGVAFVQTINVTVPDVTAPVAACAETVNPAGQTIPPAGSTTLPGAKGGQNEDGFYLLTATDNVDATPQMFVRDAGSGTVFGPFAVGTRIKYTEDPTAVPTQKSIGGPNSAVAWHIIGTGDAQVYAVDASGNTSGRVLCLVPPPPK